MSKNLELVFVDDEEQIHQIFKFYFKREVAQGELIWHHFLDAQSALDYLGENQSNRPIRLILTDINMPVMNGFEFLEKLQLDFPEIKTMVLSAYDSTDYTERAEALGSKMYFKKPIDFKALKADLMDYVSKNLIDS